MNAKESSSDLQIDRQIHPWLIEESANDELLLQLLVAREVSIDTIADRDSSDSLRDGMKSLLQTLYVCIQTRKDEVNRTMEPLT